MTRAKHSFTLSTTDNDDLRRKPSTFISEIPEENLSPVPLVDNVETIITLTTAAMPPIDWVAATRAELEHRAAKYILSVTALNAWIHSPRAFMEKYLIRQPAGKMASASFGTAVHAGLSYIANYINKHDTLPSPDLWHEEVRIILAREILTAREQTEFLALTIKTLEQYLSKTDCPLSQRAKVEEKFGWKKVVIEGISITGAIDRIEFLPNNMAQVIDFKTGKAAKSKDQLIDYERQLYFYKLLWDGAGESRTLLR